MPSDNRSWLTAVKTHEGFPLLLRRPAKREPDSVRSLFPTLLVVTHEFTKRQSNGLPEREYNAGLESLDCELVAIFDADHSGVPVLVETFGGERNYYFYVSPDVDFQGALSTFASRHPAEKISWEASRDAGWGFIEKYARDFF